VRATEIAPAASRPRQLRALIEPAAELVTAILRAAPQVRVIASSRETLRVPGEHAYPICRCRCTAQ